MPFITQKFQESAKKLGTTVHLGFVISDFGS